MLAAVSDGEVVMEAVEVSELELVADGDAVDVSCPVPVDVQVPKTVLVSVRVAEPVPEAETPSVCDLVLEGVAVSDALSSAGASGTAPAASTATSAVVRARLKMASSESAPVNLKGALPQHQPRHPTVSAVLASVRGDWAREPEINSVPLT